MKWRKHGFARKSDFELVDQTDESLSYRLLPTDASRKMYPFEFALYVRYRLKSA